MIEVDYSKVLFVTHKMVHYKGKPFTGAVIYSNSKDYYRDGELHRNSGYAFSASYVRSYYLEGRAMGHRNNDN